VQRCREVTVTATVPAIPVSKATLTLKEAQREQIVRALRESSGNRSEAARRLGIDRKSLYRTARRMGIDFDAIG